MTLQRDDSYVASGIALLIHDLQKPKLQALLASWLEAAQALEIDLWSLYSALFIDQAEGAALDQLGALVGQPRENRADVVYRAWIRARVFINRSAGVPDDSLTLVSMVEPGATATLREYAPASYIVTVSGVQTLTTRELFELLRLVKPAGVRLNVASSGDDAAHLFTLGDAPTADAAPDIDPLTGLASTDDAAIGGGFAGVAG
jgi:hypothetical protein